MVKRNPGPSTRPNAPIDLTSLMDVVFIFLFIVILAYANLQATKDEKSKQELDEIRQELKRYQNEAFDYESIKDAYNESLAEYEDFTDCVSKVSLSCPYDDNNKPHRKVTISFDPEHSQKVFDLTNDNSSEVFEQLKRELEEYITMRQESTFNSEKSEGEGLVFIYLSMKQILWTDTNKIKGIINEIMEQYDNVYFREYRPS